MDGTTIEMGANWIHGLQGKETNPLWEVAQELHMDGIMCNEEFEDNYLARDQHGNDIR